MGEVVGAGLLAHVPTIMLPRAERLAINQDRDDKDFTFERRRDFEAHEVRRVIKKSVTSLTPRVQPVTPDKGEQHIALGDFYIYDLDEVDS